MKLFMIFALILSAHGAKAAVAKTTAAKTSASETIVCDEVLGDEADGEDQSHPGFKGQVVITKIGGKIASIAAKRTALEKSPAVNFVLTPSNAMIQTTTIKINTESNEYMGIPSYERIVANDKHGHAIEVNLDDHMYVGEVGSTMVYRLGAMKIATDDTSMVDCATPAAKAEREKELKELMAQ